MSIHTDQRKALFKQKNKITYYETPFWFFNKYNKTYKFEWDMASSKKNALCKNYVTKKLQIITNFSI